MKSMDAVLLAGGGVAHRSALLDSGLTSFELGRAVHSGRLTRVRRAWYALPSADPEIVRAVRVGGALTSVSVAAVISRVQRKPVCDPLTLSKYDS